MSVVSGWRLALRLAWRDAWRHRARSALVLFMVTFPVVAVVSADVAQATSSVSSVEGLDRRIGASQALVTAVPMSGKVLQRADPSGPGTYLATGHPAAGPSLAEIEAALGGTPRPAVEIRLRQLPVATGLGRIFALVTAVDLRDPLASGLFRLTSGRLPTRPDEVLVNSSLADHGFAIGDVMHLGGGRVRTIVGTAESAETRTQPIVVGPLSSLPPSPARSVRSWLVGGAPVSWSQVEAANAVGATVLSRAVIAHPPPRSEIPVAIRPGPAHSSQTYAVLALVAVMALMEIVLLAGPAFAVGARRQSRALALLAANGGTPPQARRVVLGSAVVVGGVGAVLGSVLGLGVARLLLPVLQRKQDTWFGPYQVRWTHVLAIAAFGLLSAVLAAVVPAWIASRQDVVAVLAGRRGDRAAGRLSPFIGLALLGLGIVGAVLGARQGSGELVIAGSAVVSVFGMIFLVPVVVVTVARLGRGLPLPLRYAVRDAARHRTRTVPAVAAVAATVAGVVALSIGNASSQSRQEAGYAPQVPDGTTTLVSGRTPPDYATLQAAARRVAPAARQDVVVGLGRHDPQPQVGWRHQPSRTWEIFTPFLVVTPDQVAGWPLLADFFTPAEQRSAAAALSRGEPVAITRGRVAPDALRLRTRTTSGPRTLHLPVLDVPAADRVAPAWILLPPSFVQQHGLHATPAALLLSGPTLTRDQQSRLSETLAGIDPQSYLYVERGYQTPGSTQVLLWILFGMAGVLMLGGTLTATFLALSDARPDLATLSAVGAAPRTRRGVAAAYAVAVGGVGAVLGAAVGFIPGIAISYPLTRTFAPVGPSHYLTVPWLLIGSLVVALPLLTALVVGLLTRSRLPVVARLD
jgi:putative ABC transport system permease protein